LAKAFVQKDFNKRNPGSFKRKKVLKNIFFVAMTDFGPDLDSIITAYPGLELTGTLPMAISDISQLYMAETEKYAHVTYFFNGGYAGKVDSEETLMVPSPDVKSYDQTPGMKTKALTEILLKYLNEKKGPKYDISVLNFAAPDMVAHTGNLEAGIECCNIVDDSVKEIVESYLRYNGTVIITSDHGNIEGMINLKTGEIDTEHSTKPVPFILVNKKLKNKKLREKGALGDIAPTILDLIGKEKPREMEGKSLLK
jgi:2,3-bisphosphoglycerate-independent phosphoglycerate mutase